MTDAQESQVAHKTASLMISYSRKDKVFVKQLYDGLVAKGFSPEDIWVDWEGIPLSADWMAEITKGIRSSNAFIFVISPDSVASEVCRKEIELAVESNKRFIPILYREPGKDGKLHEKISSHNWVFIRDEQELEKTLPALVEAINTDLDWLAQHTRLFNRAKEWDAKGRNDSYLVRGNDLEDAEAFISQGAAGKEPAPTKLHTEYVTAAQKFAAAVRRRNRIIAAVVGVVLLALTIYAVIQAISARDSEKKALVNLDKANTEQVRADNNAATAVANEEIAKENEAVANANAREANALALASEAINQKNSDTQLSLMLALLSIQETAGDSDLPLDESRTALFSSLNTPNVLHTWDNEGSIVWATAFDPQGNYLAFGGADGLVRVFDADSREEIYTLQFDDRISGLDFSPDGRKLGVSSRDGTAIVFDAGSGDELFALTGHDGAINDIDFNPDGNLIATGGDDTLVKVWDAGTGSIRVTLPSHTDVINSVEFDAYDGNYLVSGSSDNTAIMWDLNTNSLVSKLRPDGFNTYENYVDSVAFQGSRIITGGYQSVIVWDADDGSVVYRLRGNQANVYSVAFAPDGLSMATASSGIKIWDWFLGTERYNLSAHRGEVTSVAYNQDGNLILSGSWDNTAKLWAANLKIETQKMRQHFDLNLDANYSLDGKWIVTTDGSGYVLVHDASTGEVRYEFVPVDDEWVRAASFNPQDSRQLVTGDDAGQLAVWELGSDDPRWLIQAHDGSVDSAVYSPDGNIIISAGEDGFVRTWDSQTGNPLMELNSESTEAQFSPDGQRIVTTYFNGAQIIDAVSREVLVELVGHTDAVLAAIFSRNGNFIYTAGYDNTIRKWDAATGQELLVMTGHTGRIFDLDISPDDSQVASASADTTVRIWNAVTGKEIYKYEGNNEDANSVAFSPDGRRVLTASSDNTSKEFTIDYQTLLEIAQEYELRPLTQEECQRFLKRDNCTLTLFGGSPSTAGVSSSPSVPATPTPVPAQVVQATSTPTPVPAAAPVTSTPVPTATSPNTQAFYTEEFDGDLGTWESFLVTGVESQVASGVDGGSLFVQLSQYEEKIPRFYLVQPGYEYTSVQMELVTTNFGNNANGVSLVCNYNGENWYEFTISNAGLYSINAYDPTATALQGYVQLAAGGSAAIKSGQATNVYRAVCNGSELTLYINDVLVKTITDTKYSLTGGKIGLGVSSPQMLPVEVSFGSLTVSQP